MEFIAALLEEGTKTSGTHKFRCIKAAIFFKLNLNFVDCMLFIFFILNNLLFFRPII